MTHKVALFHTSLVFFQREPMLFRLLEELLPATELFHIVEDSMLRQVLAQGRVSAQITRRVCLYTLAAHAMGVDAIFNTCSSVGPAFDVARQMVPTPVVKIDDGMAEEASRRGKRIGVLATVPTTLQPTIDLIREKATLSHREIEVAEGLCHGAFQLLMEGEIQSHDQMVSEKAKALSQWADTLVLAQCSMARLEPRLSEETGLPVLSSPRLGVERLKAALSG